MDNSQRFPLQPLSHHPALICGEVRMDPTVVIGSGVILQATTDSSITIEAGVCIGVGVVITAHQGQVMIKQGVVLGAGTLIIGIVDIGEETCIGRASTIINTSIPREQVIAPFTVVGDRSRQINQASRDRHDTPNPIPDHQGVSGNPEPLNENLNQSTTRSSSFPVENQGKTKKSPVIGQVYVNELLLTIFNQNDSC
ncbi:MAG: carbon dioxide concentrating mechanism protein [Synechococcaceae cyanobacterium RL_1_2]|nr:carbon dioxide concentrating mechanism protein [Synechococcaceae cyanobacterium RL_1_2]